MKHAVLFGDTHIPYEDPQAIEVVTQLIQLVEPDLVCHVGDLVDAWQLNRFPKDPTRSETLQYDICNGVAVLETVVPASVPTMIYLLGNHEARQETAIWSMKDTSRAVMGLDVVEKYITWPKILEEAGLSGWKVVPYDQQPIECEIPKFLLMHGDLISSKAGAAAHREHEKYGRSGASGHTHRLGSIYRADWNGNHNWVETGCLCLLNPVGNWAQHPNWQHGAVVVSYEDDWFSTELIYIQDGRAQWRGHTIQA